MKIYRHLFTEPSKVILKNDEIKMWKFLSHHNIIDNPVLQVLSFGWGSGAGNQLDDENDMNKKPQKLNHKHVLFEIFFPMSFIFRVTSHKKGSTRGGRYTF